METPLTNVQHRRRWTAWTTWCLCFQALISSEALSRRSSPNTTWSSESEVWVSALHSLGMERAVFPPPPSHPVNFFLPSPFLPLTPFFSSFAIKEGIILFENRSFLRSLKMSDGIGTTSLAAGVASFLLRSSRGKRCSHTTFCRRSPQSTHMNN